MIPLTVESRVSSAAKASLSEEFEWLRGRLLQIVERERALRDAGPAADYRGIFVTDQEVDVLLSTPTGSWAGSDTHPVGNGSEAGLRSGGRVRKVRGRHPLEKFVDVFGLSPTERLLLLIAFAIHIDRQWERLFAYVNDDVSRKRPSVAIALQALSDDPDERQALQALLRVDAPLMRHRLVDVIEESAAASPTLLASSLALDPHAATVLLGGSGIDVRVRGFASFEAAQADSDGESPLARIVMSRPGSRVYLGGRWPGERLDTARRGVAAAGYGLIAIDSRALRTDDQLERAIALLARDARLLKAAVYFDGWALEGERDPAVERMARAIDTGLESHPLPVLFGGRPRRPAIEGVSIDVALAVDGLGLAARERAWHEALPGLATTETAHVAAAFALSGRDIGAAGRAAHLLAAARGAESPTAVDLHAAARLQSQPRLSDVARLVEPRLGWHDIVLPEDRMVQLREVVAQALHRDLVYESWGFGRKVTSGRGVASLFVGEPGTGKTMAAEVMAGELGVDLYKVDLAGLVSKYIGETEKNLARVFDEASESSAILFFDEADSLFGKRTEVRDSHDRYANIEVSYLLQKMEEYEGVVILASNLRANLDEAFQRRLKAAVDFPFPEDDDRLRIYEKLFEGVSAPLSPSLDLPWMARRFRFSGGSIKNVVLLAAFLAAEEGTPISREHLVHAARREFQKLGRLVNSADFDPR